MDPHPPQQPQGDQDDRPLTHVDASGRVRMVNVTAKPFTHRRAVARCRVDLGPSIIDALTRETDQRAPAVAPTLAELLAVAKVAGMQAAKQTANLIPLCHTLAISNVDVSLTFVDGGVEIEGSAEVIGPTGVEMEALTACTFAALSVASAAVEAGDEATIGAVTLWEKSGGRSGNWVRESESLSTLPAG